MFCCRLHWNLVGVMMILQALVVRRSPIMYSQAFRGASFLKLRRSRPCNIRSSSSLLCPPWYSEPSCDRRRHRFFPKPIITRSVGTLSQQSNPDIDVTTSTAYDNTNNNYDLNSPILADLNPSQIEAVTQPMAAVTRVLAGPGSGKTRVLTSRIAHILESGNQNRVLGVTFTRKAAGEMQLRLHKLLLQTQEASTTTALNNNNILASSDETSVVNEENVGEPYPQGLHRVTLGTFHSICAKILRWNGDLLHTLPSIQRDMAGSKNATVLDGSFGIVDESEQLRIIRDCLEDENIDLSKIGLKPKPILMAIGECKSLVSKGQDLLRDDEKEKPSKAMQIALKLYYKYREKLLASNCLDFDDLILLSRELLLEHAQVRERLQRRWPHVLVDEFQDTSQTQMDFVKLLTSSSLLVVGDADQSIYSWRGAHVGSLSDFEDEFGGFLGEVKTIYLMENYRSTSNIVKAAQKVISHSSGGKAQSGADKLRQAMKPKRGSGKAPRVVSFENDEAEAQFAVTSVKSALTAGNYSASHSVAFIYRTNAQSRALEEACVQHNLPYVIFGSATSFYKRQEIKDCLSFLRWLYNGRDRSAMLRAMVTPKRGLGDVAVEEFDSYCSQIEAYHEENYPGRATPTPLDVLLSLSERSREPLDPNVPRPSGSFSKRTAKILVEFSSQMRSIRDRALSEPLEKVLAAVIGDMRLISHLDKISKSTSEFEERKQNVQELQRATQSYTKRGPCLALVKAEGADNTFLQSPLGDFLDDVSLVTDLAERSSEERFVVNLMTVHASKGMEFDTVFVVGTEDGTFPTSQSLHDEKALEEEKRLCYVAMTRAKSELLLTWRRQVKIFTPNGIQTVERERSRFLDILVGGAEKKDSDQGVSEPSTSSSAERSYGKTATSDFIQRRSYGKTSISDFTQRRQGKPNSWGGPQFQRKKDFSTVSDLNPKRVTARLEGTTSIYAKQTPSPFKPSSRPSSDEPLIRRSPTRHVPSAEKDYSTASDFIPKRVTARLEGTTKHVPSTGKDYSTASDSGPKRVTARLVAGTTSNHATQNPPHPVKQLPRNQAAEKKPRTPIDSTWFFPIGSRVVHKSLGKGTVLPPPSITTDKKAGVELLVLVEFENGKIQRFDAVGSDLAPAL